jgi:hypothetical protein
MRKYFYSGTFGLTEPKQLHSGTILSHAVLGDEEFLSA